MKKEVFNVEIIFDAEILNATNLIRKEIEYEQVNVRIDRRGGLSASSIYTNVGTVCINSVAALKAQMYRLEKEGNRKREQRSRIRMRLKISVY